MFDASPCASGFSVAVAVCPFAEPESSATLSYAGPARGMKIMTGNFETFILNAAESGQEKVE